MAKEIDNHWEPINWLVLVLIMIVFAAFTPAIIMDLFGVDLFEQGQQVKTMTLEESTHPKE